VKVKKRNGRLENFNVDKINECAERASKNLDNVSASEVLIDAKIKLYDKVTTTEIDKSLIMSARSKIEFEPNYAYMAARMLLNTIYKEVFGEGVDSDAFELQYRKSFITNMRRLVREEILNEELLESFDLRELSDKLNIDREKDWKYLGIQTIYDRYLLHIEGRRMETPQAMWMRIAMGLALNEKPAERQAYALKFYETLSCFDVVSSTPTLFNSGTPKPQMSSCFLLTMKDDSIDGIYDTLKQTAKISQSAGGIGLSIHNIRATGSYISGTNGTSNGIVPMLQVYNDTARYVDQGGGKRKGSFAIYLEPWHADIFEFLDLKKNHGKEEMRARDLFYAMWIPDLFMKRVQEDGTWTLMCPNECPDLYNTHGDEFDTLYLDYEARDKGRKTIKARLLWEKILESQIETGTPYMLYKDAANRKSNQKNLGTIRSSNLCTEIMEYTSPGEVAVCNLASIALPMFVKNGEFDHKELFRVTKRVTKNLNKVIDRNYYPVIEAEYSNFKHRPIGLGIQGLADAFIMLRMPFTSDEAKKLNQEIFETLYFAAVTASMEEAKVDGPYESYKGSPISKGEFQHNMWNIKDEELSGRWDWGKLRKSVKKHGVRNSLLVAPMPTASTSQILGNNEAFEPYTSNIYTRRVLSGEFIVVNKHLLEDLVNLGLWNDDLKEEIMRQNGSVQNVDIPQDLKELYKTVWELSMKDIIDMSRHRGYFIDQSQSLNLFMENANMAKLTSMHFYAWKSGLKTGMYYLRTKSAVDAIKFTLSKKEEKEQPTVPVKEAKVEAATNAVSDKPMSPQEFREMLSKSQNGEPDDDCLMCGS